MRQRQPHRRTPRVFENPLFFSNHALVRLLVPLVIEQLLAVTIGMADTVMVTSVGEAAVSGISLVDSINILIVQAFFALASGGTVVCSHYLGCKKQDHAKEAARQLIFITFCLPCL